ATGTGTSPESGTTRRPPIRRATRRRGRRGRSTAPASRRRPQEDRQQKIRRGETAREEAAHGDERRDLPVGQSRYRVTRRAAAGVRRAEADEKPAGDDADESPQRQERRGAEDLARRQTGEVVNAQRLQIGDRARRERKRRRRREPPGERRAGEDAGQQREIPQTLAFPVVREELDAAGRY